MSDTPIPMPAGHASPQWGYERKDCRGANALGLFIDDLQKVLDSHTGRVNASPAALYQAQADANELLRQYVNVEAAPAVFAGQSITLKTAGDGAGALQLVPLFSATLKQALITLLHAGGSRQ
jgi:hypothetical protein